MKRRQFLGLGLLALPTLYTLSGPTRAATMTLDELHDNWRDFLPDDFDPPDAEDSLELSEDAWRARLAPLAFDVLREEATERPGTSAMKFDSGTGWPSFFTHIPGAFGTKKDFKLVWPRTEYHCARCGGHHGHVFKDGPRPTGERWCNNGVALRFLPAEGRS